MDEKASERKIQLAHNPDFREMLERVIREIVAKQVSESLNKGS